MRLRVGSRVTPVHPASDYYGLVGTVIRIYDLVGWRSEPTIRVDWGEAGESDWLPVGLTAASAVDALGNLVR